MQENDQVTHKCMNDLNQVKPTPNKESKVFLHPSQVFKRILHQITNQGASPLALTLYPGLSKL